MKTGEDYVCGVRKSIVKHFTFHFKLFEFFWRNNNMNFLYHQLACKSGIQNIILTLSCIKIKIYVPEVLYISIF